jgi:uncharacterized protein (DUF885 family)
MSAVRALADDFHERWLATHPFAASIFGVPGYDGRVPDDSEAGEASRRSELESTLVEVDRLELASLSEPDGITLACLRENAVGELRDLDVRLIEHTVTAMPFSGPSELLATAARTVLADEQAAADHLERVRAGGTWIDQQTERLQIGAARGRLPVAPLVQEAIEWAEYVLEPAVPEALATPEPPAGWAGEAAWRDERDGLAADVVRPALIRWLELLRELMPRARPGDEPGLVYLPDGDTDYALCVESATTLPLAPEEIHRIGLSEVERLEGTAVGLGAELNLRSLPEIYHALRESSGRRLPSEAMAAATAAIRRAEARVGECVLPPLPPPCEVTPMPDVVATSGMAPHYTAPTLDGTRPGTFWFNLERPTAGTGWDLEGVAFHEGVPGHHLQIARLQMLDGLPAMQRQRGHTVYLEGWALYAEQLAEEMDLYLGIESRLGSLAPALLRAARLVVDTGIHALGWSRRQALEFMVAHVPMPEAFLANEIDRYIVMPGQALSYLIGKREIVRMRDDARRRLGPRFAVPDFHAVVLDSGSLPMVVLDEKVRTWAAAGLPAP